MKVLVAVKRVVDHNIQVRVKPDGKGVDTAHVKMSMNPFDEVAIEEAVRQKEKGKISTVISVSCGVKSCEETLRTSMAMGADRALHVETDIVLQPLAVAKLLAAVAKHESPQLILLGKQAIDDDANQVGQMLAAFLGWGQATFVSNIELTDDEVTVQREIDGGTETLKLVLPCVITTDLRLNDPRYVKLPDIMNAKKKPLEKLSPLSLGVDVTPRLQQLKVEDPPLRKAGQLIDSAVELVTLLKQNTKVLG